MDNATATVVTEAVKVDKRVKYVGVPKELVCTHKHEDGTVCGNKISIVPGVLVAKVKKASEETGHDITVEEYVASWKCQECKPTKGRRVSPENADIPEALTCTECHKSFSCSRGSIIQRAKLKGQEVHDYANSYVCQGCKPTRGRVKVVEVAVETTEPVAAETVTAEPVAV